MTAYFYFSWACTALLTIDAARRPESAWVIADRNRSGWLGFCIPLGLIGLGPLCLLAYAVGVLPRFGRPAPEQTRRLEDERPFRKKP